MEYIQIRSVRELFADAYRECLLTTDKPPRNWIVSPVVWARIKEMPWAEKHITTRKILPDELFGIPVLLEPNEVPQYVTENKTKEWV